MLSWKRFVPLVCVLGALAVPAAASAASISGHVYGGAGTGTPLENVSVQIHNADFSVEGHATTDATGAYTIDSYDPGTGSTALPADNYVVEFVGAADQDWLDQYYDGTASGTTDEQSATPVSAGTPTNIDAHLVQGGSIAGTVTDPSDATVSNVCVSAWLAGSFSPSSSASTRADGTYTLHKLAAGNYHVEFVPCDSGTLNFVTEWWTANGQPGAADQSGASPVAVTAGSTNTPINQKMEQGGTITGTVDDGTTGLANICVTAYLPTAGNEGEVPVGFAQTADGTGADAIGTYTMNGLRKGSYKLQFSDCDGADHVTQWYNDESSFDTADQVSVDPSGAAATANATLVKAGSLSGKVVDAGNNPLANICVDVFHGNVDPYGPDGNNVNPDGGTQTAADGTYSVPGLAPGVTYSVHFSDCSGGDLGNLTYLSGWYHNQAAFPGNGVSITAGNNSALSDQTMVQGGQITGHVTDGTNNLPNICVAATDQTSHDEYDNTTNASGNFDLTGLPTGSYVLQTSDCHNTGGFIAQYWDGVASTDSATAISVTQSQTTALPHAITLAKGGTINGRVTDGSNGLANICVDAFSESGNDGFAETDTSGNYSITGLPFDTYTVSFMDCNAHRNWINATYPSQVTISNGTPVTLSDQVLQAGAHIAGHVTGGGNPLQNICVDAQQSDGFGSGEASTNVNGDYDIGGLTPGTYTVSFSDCSGDGLWVDQWYDGSSTEAGATPVTLTAQQDRTGVNATMIAAGTISGAITDGSTHNPVTSGACVYIYAPGATSETDYLDVVTAGNSGTWTSPGLAPGSYLVGFGPCEEDGSFAYAWQFWTGSSGGAATLAGAQPVTVTVSHVTTGTDAALGLDTTAPNTFISSAPSGTTNSTSADVTFYADEPFVAFSCQVDSQPATTCGSPYHITGLSSSQTPHTFKVWAVDKAGNGGPTANAVTASWTVDTGSSSGSTSTSGTVGPGGTFTDSPSGTTSAGNPLATSVMTPAGGQVSITDSNSITQSSPTGFTLFGHELTITAPPATTGSPLQITVTIDHSIIPAGTDKSKLTLTRDGAPAADCLGSSTANPDPCVTSRSIDGLGNVTLTVLSSHASTWNVAAANATSNTGGGGSGGSGGSGGTNTTPTTPTSTTTTTTPTTTGSTTTTTPSTPAATKCVVPKLVGLTLANAKKALAKAHCGVGKISKKAAKPKKGKKAKRGTVIAQSPAAGTKKPAGSKVAITLAK